MQSTHRRRLALLAPLICVFASILGPAKAETDYSAKVEAFEKFARQQIAEDPIPGISIGFLKGDFTWAAGFGYSDLENQVAAKAESAYRLASVTKPMTAVAVLKLASEGKLDLDAEVQTYVPYFPRKKWPVTVRALLGHLGGVSHYQDYSREGHFKNHLNTREAIAVFEDFDLVAEPWTRFNYSSYGYNLLGAVVESVSGRSYGDYMREEVWGPLGMDATRMDDPDDLIPNRVRGYRPGPGGSLINSEFVDVSSRFAAGGTRSTVIDLLKFARGVLDGRVLTPQRYQEMFDSMATRDGTLTGYGMGWGVTSVNGRFAVAHSGAQPETATNLMIFPAHDFAIAFACNLEGGQRAPYIEALYRIVEEEAYLPPAYTGSRESDATYQAMSRVMESGGSHFDRFGEPLSEDPGELRPVFRYFEESVDPKNLESDFDAARRRIIDGTQPRAGRPFTALGSFMSARIVETLGESALERAHRLGPLEFFAAYSRAAETSGLEAGLRFPKAFAKRVEAWREDWNRVWTEPVWNLATVTSAGFAAKAPNLKGAFEERGIYPNLMGRFDESIEASYLTGDLPKAAELAGLAVDLYPELDQANLLAGLVALAMGESERASALIAKAAEINPNGAGSAGGLNGWAYRFKGLGQTRTGLALLQIAVGLYPDVANLYDSRGEFLFELGDREAAIESYEKALDIDPGFENAKRMLEKIRSGG